MTSLELIFHSRMLMLHTSLHAFREGDKEEDFLLHVHRSGTPVFITMVWLVQVKDL